VRRVCAGTVLVLCLTGCASPGDADPKITAPSATTSTGSTPVTDQKTQLEATAAELRSAVDALSALVPTPTSASAPVDKAFTCTVGADDDGSKQWVYDPGFRYPGTGADVIELAAAELQRRGYAVGQRSSSAEEMSFTAVKGGAAITVRDGHTSGELDSAVVFSGYGPCVSPDGTIDTDNPS